MTFKGAMIRKGYPTPGNQSIATSTNTFVSFQQVDYDTDSFYNASNPTRLTVPAGVDKVRVHAQCIWQSNSTGLRQLVIKKNGAFYPGDPCVNVVAAGGTTTDIDTHSPVLMVEPGDYFEMEVFHTAGSTIDLLASTGTYLAIEAVE